MLHWFVRFFHVFSRFPADVRRGYFLFLFIFIYLIPLVFITATCLAITRALMQKIPVDPGTDPRALSLERGRRKVQNCLAVSNTPRELFPHVMFLFLFRKSSTNPYIFIITSTKYIHTYICMYLMSYTENVVMFFFLSETNRFISCNLLFMYLVQMGKLFFLNT